jgi:hypothetical protein
MIGLIMEEQPTMEEILRALREKDAKESTNIPDPEPRPLSPEIERAIRE